MKARLLLLLFLLSVPLMGWSQSTLNFPKFFSAAELPLSGFAIVNPGPTTASVTFTLYGANGTSVSSSTLSFAPGSQKAKSGNEIFGSTVSSGGWVQVTSATTGLQGFWLNYANDISFIDGTEAARSALDEVIPLVAGATELNIANPNGASNSVTIRLFGEAGTELSATPITQTVAGNGVFQGDVASLFTGVNMVNARYLKITGSLPLVSTAVIRGYLVPKDDAVVNGSDRTTTLTQLNFPHAVSGAVGGGSYTTELGITNLSASSQPVTISFTPAAGGPPTTITQQLAGNGAIRKPIQTLFGFDPAKPNGYDGWVQVNAGLPIAGFVAYADTVAGGVAVVSVQDTPKTQMLFAHIADLAPFWTGLALLNTNSTPATVNVYAVTPDGALIGGADNLSTAKFTLQPNTKAAKLLLELVPQTQTRTADGGFIFVTSNVPLYAIELFFNRNLSALANVPAGSVTTGITYTPPGAAQPLTISSVSPRSVARGGSLTVTGSGFSATPAGDTVIFAGVNGSVTASATTSTATTLSVIVPATAVSGAVQVQTGGQATTATNTVVDVLATPTTLLQSSIVVAAGQTVSSADIYVPTVGAGALNATLVGVADVGASQIFFGTSSVEVAHGTTKLLVLAGTGITNSSVVSISGQGVTVTGQPALSTLNDGTPFIQVTINVAANAPLGPRNVVVTNTDAQASMVTGGIFIR